MSDEMEGTETAAARAMRGTEAGRAGSVRRLSLPLREIWPRLLAVVIVLVIWTALALMLPKLIPSPLETFTRVVQIIVTGTFLFNMSQTLFRVLVGLVLALFFGTAIGVVMGTSALGEKMLDFFVVIGLTIPGLIWAFIAVMLFGLLGVGPIFAVTFATTPMLAVNLWQGVKSVDRDLIDMATVYRLDRKTKLREIVLPHLGPHLMAATRFGLGLAWKAVVIVEMFGASNGIGFQLQAAYEGFDMASVLAWTISFLLVMMIIEYGILLPVDVRLVRWRPRANVWRR